MLISTLLGITFTPTVTHDTAATASTTPSTMMFLRLFVVNQNLSVFAIAMRFMFGDLHHCKHTLGLVEYRVHLLQGPICRFWVEEVYHRYDEGITASRVSKVLLKAPNFNTT